MKKNCYICKRNFEDKYAKDKNVRDYCHYKGEHIGAVYVLCYLKYSVLKEISIIFHNGSN